MITTPVLSFEKDPAASRSCPFCGADAGPPCIPVVDQSDRPWMHFARCLSDDPK